MQQNGAWKCFGGSVLKCTLYKTVRLLVYFFLFSFKVTPMQGYREDNGSIYKYIATISSKNKISFPDFSNP